MTIQAKRPSQAGRPVDIFFRGGFDFNLILGWHSEKQTDSGIPSDTYIIKTFLQFPEQRGEWELAFIPES